MSILHSTIPPFEYSELLGWFAKNGRKHLPWRKFEGLGEKELGYRVWLSEILLQQTQADRVIGFYNRILERFPSIESLASSSYEEFFPYYQGLGYYSRARNMLCCAAQVTSEHAGFFPKDSGMLRELPGIGPYTSEAIRSFAYGIPTLSFDTNLDKVFSRYYHGSRFIKLSKSEKAGILEQFLKTGLDSRLVNAAFMDLASLYSGNSKYLVDHSKSPFKNCKFAATKGALEVETKKASLYFPTKDARVEVILHKNHREYYSSKSGKYAAFELPPTLEDLRKHVQDFFRQKYSLEVSVRPPHKKEYRNDVPYVCMNAQIQAGVPGFEKYSRTEIE